MIYIAINVVFNAFLLAIVMMFGTDAMHIKPVYAWCLAYVIAGGLTIIGYTRIANTIVSLFMPGRQMIGREKAKLQPLLSEVIEQTNREYGTTYKLSDFKVKVTDDKVVNAFAVGYNTITVGRGTFDAFTNDQLRAILAHEMGHLYYRDSVRSIALIFSSFSTRIVMTIYGVFLAISAALGMSAGSVGKGDAGIAMLMASWMLFVFCLPIIVLNWIGAKVFNLINMRMSRRAEYRADAFAASLGYKSDMISALEVLDEISVYDNSFRAKLMATHPPSMQRIGALEDGEVAKQNIGGLAIAMPFVSGGNTVSVNHNGEFIRLTMTLGVAGLLWCAWGVYGEFTKSKPVISEHRTVSGNSQIIQHATPDNTVSKLVSEPKQATVQPVKPKPKIKEARAEKKSKKKAVTKSNQAKASNMVTIDNVYKVSDSSYSVTYTDNTGKHVVIKHSRPAVGNMTADAFNRVQ